MVTCSWSTSGNGLTPHSEHNVGASYGAFPPKIANSINCSLEEAEQIFNAYHNELYPKITEYRENYVLPTCHQNKKLHLGLGFYINTKDPDTDIRTLANASIQFWSILSILAINELHRRIDSAGYQSQIKVISSIYDSIYLEVLDDPAILQWANNNLIECMTRDFMPNQTVPNVAESEIGYSWASLKSIPNNASTGYILATRHLLLHKDHEINVLQAKKEKTPDDFARITALWTQLVAHYEST